jgi:hypothetical protein
MARTLSENLSRQLCDSVDRLQKQVESVQFWADALRGVTAPIPDFEPNEEVLARVVRVRSTGTAKTHRRRVTRRQRAAH